MWFKTKISAQRKGGFSLVEVIVAAAVTVIVFGGLFVGFKHMIDLVGVAKVKSGALALATDKMEYLRSLPYNSLGTEGGVPAGDIVQTSTTTLNKITYTEDILIQYVDDPADGLEGSDENAIMTDYKQIRVKESWVFHDKTGSIALVSNVVPTGIETTAGGGTIKVNVFDAAVQPLSGIPVRFINDTTTSTIDTIRYTNASGVAYLSGAPAASNYQMIVTNTGYSTDGTYVATSTNPNPTTPPIAVVESQVSTMNFQIDRLSDLQLLAVAPATYATFADTFTDSSNLATVSSTTVAAGAVVLSGGAGAYASAGYAVSTTTAPAAIDSWYSLDFNLVTGASTAATVQVYYDNGGVLTLVPDGDLPGNSAGFTSGPVDLSGLSVATYAGLVMRVNLSSTDITATPELQDWTLTYIKSQTPIAGANLYVYGSKIIGTDASSNPVLKYESTGTTDTNGQLNLTDIEYDTYSVDMADNGYDIKEICPMTPYSLDPGASESVKLTLGAYTGHMLRVKVTDVLGAAIPNATVRLQNTGVDEQATTSVCGQAYLSTGLYADGGYNMTVSAVGYLDSIFSSTTVGVDSNVEVVLNQ